MSYNVDDTIVAVASAAGGAARGIVRLSGPAAIECLNTCFTPVTQSATAGLPSSAEHAKDNAAPRSSGTRIAPRQATGAHSSRFPHQVIGHVVVPGFAAPVPCDALVWPTRRSYTRQPTVELHTFGSPPLLNTLVRTLCAGGARLALPGEFTLRAFLAGRLDLTQAEAVLGVIDAPDAVSLRTALDQLAGGLGAPLAALRGGLLDLLAHLEAGLDFVEEDIEFIAPAELERQLASARDLVAELSDRMIGRGSARDVVRIVLRGWPNVGKSSLFNVLAPHAAALVSPRAGTTRDYLTHDIFLGGIPCELIDTAGVDRDETRVVHATSVDDMAQRQTAAQVAQADVEVLCLDASRALNDWETAELSRPVARPRIVALTKIDQPRRAPAIDAALPTSSATGKGIDELRARLGETARTARTTEGHCVAATAVRCRDSLRGATAALDQALEAARSRRGEELVAAEVRLALDELGQVTGVVYTDDVLDRIFSRFCIGK